VTDGPHPPSWGMRVLAPLAFFAAATVLVLLVQDALNSGNETASPAAREEQPTTAARTAPSRTGTGPAGPATQRRFYVIKTGDTLDTIAERFDTTVDDLLSLNPNIVPNALRPGQRIRIR
jgi:LysM repeat protein